MNKLAYLKIAARFVVGSGTTTVTHSIIRNNVAPTNALQAVSVGVASLVIGSMASEATKSHTDAKIDEFAALWNSSKSKDETTVTA